MSLLFIEGKCVSLLKETEPYNKESMVKNLFPYSKGEELKRKEHLFEVAMDIMKAKSTSALDKYSTEDFIKCVEVHDEVCMVLENAKAGKILDNFKKVIQLSKSCKKRRVL